MLQHYYEVARAVAADPLQVMPCLDFSRIDTVILHRPDILSAGFQAMKDYDDERIRSVFVKWCLSSGTFDNIVLLITSKEIPCGVGL